MAADKLRLRIMTPDRTKLEESVEMVILRCVTGDMGILAHHENCSLVLDEGVLRMVTDGVERRMAIYGGVAHMVDNVLTVLANGAQWPEDIDRAKAEAERDRAERLMRESSDKLEMQKNQILVRRALVQIEVSAYPLITKQDRGG